MLFRSRWEVDRQFRGRCDGLGRRAPGDASPICSAAIPPAIGRVNRFDENEAQQLVKPHGFVLNCSNTLVEHFRDLEGRKDFFKLDKELDILDEIISPDAFLRPFLDDSSAGAAMDTILRNTYPRIAIPDRDFQRKTNAMIRQYVGLQAMKQPRRTVVIDHDLISILKG